MNKNFTQLGQKTIKHMLNIYDACALKYKDRKVNSDVSPSRKGESRQYGKHALTKNMPLNRTYEKQSGRQLTEGNQQPKFNDWKISSLKTQRGQETQRSYRNNKPQGRRQIQRIQKEEVYSSGDKKQINERVFRNIQLCKNRDLSMTYNYRQKKQQEKKKNTMLLTMGSSIRQKIQSRYKKQFRNTTQNAQYSTDLAQTSYLNQNNSSPLQRQNKRRIRRTRSTLQQNSPLNPYNFTHTQVTDYIKSFNKSFTNDQNIEKKSNSSMYASYSPISKQFSLKRTQNQNHLSIKINQQQYEHKIKQEYHDLKWKEQNQQHFHGKNSHTRRNPDKSPPGYKQNHFQKRQEQNKKLSTKKNYMQNKDRSIQRKYRQLRNQNKQNISGNLGAKNYDIQPKLINSSQISTFSNQFLQKQKTHQYQVSKKLKLKDFIMGERKGQGKFGTVFSVIHKPTGFLYALKKIKKQAVSAMKEQFIQQLKISLFCDHPNIAKTYGFFIQEGIIYILMEFMQQGNLFSLIKKNKVFSENQVQNRLNEICQGIKYLHQNGILHRDIKPQNIVLTNNVCKICDFGWSALNQHRRQTYCGTLDYVCPQILQGQSYDQCVDIWAVGVLSYQMLTGKAPFYNISRKQTMKKILKCSIEYPLTMSSEAIAFIQKAIKRDPNLRTQIKQLLLDPFLKNNKPF